MQRTITEGSTIVVKAIYTNSVEQLREAFQCAPHGERAHWMLKVQVGTQSITPLYWSVRSGALESASVIICDCLTFRADRGKYYYAADELFEPHSDIVKMLCDEAPRLLPTLLSGLIWRCARHRPRRFCASARTIPQSRAWPLPRLASRGGPFLRSTVRSVSPGVAALRPARSR